MTDAAGERTVPRGTVRIFIGTLLSGENQAHYRRLTAEWCRRHPDALRQVPDGSVHLTHVFIGDVPDDELPAIAGATAVAAAATPAIPLVFGTPRLLWAGRTPRLIDAPLVSGEKAAMRLVADLTGQLRAVVAGVELRPARSAHATLARFRRGATRDEAKKIEAALAGEPRRDLIGRLDVIASVLTPQGPVYESYAAHTLA